MPAAKRFQGNSNRREPQQATVARLLGAHDIVLERLKVALTVILFAPKGPHEVIKAAANWKARSKAEEHPDKRSCTCAPDSSPEAFNKAMSGDNFGLMGTARLVEVVGMGGAHLIVADISLNTPSARTPELSLYQTTMTSSIEGHLMRTTLSGITQPDGRPNAKYQPLNKSR